VARGGPALRDFPAARLAENGAGSFPLDRIHNQAAPLLGSSDGMRSERPASGSRCAFAKPETTDHSVLHDRAIWAVPEVAETGV
jgi:hypothetical protein